ncbi:hypothetical protein tinsulaeT_30970 [Thalassotalea insulae]|uniref:Dicarboxylate transport domain-containing protein n=1 Tax=Thalassotalea insulae TaxID=2056778 RepID=A0ABQ6GYV1_9GAMM|nr:YdbH domain-containing protein [Thalassotalea insulae]GLX79757.1 hypothetical protein tinsulaeT_30970 [Thalassotalea insulae]
MTTQQANQPLHINKVIKIIALILLLSLLLLWLASPVIIKKLISHYLPAPWAINELVINYPTLSGINITQVTLENNAGTKVKLNELAIPYRYRELSWQLDTLKVTVKDSDSRNALDNQPFQLPITAINPLPINLKINHTEVQINDFRFNGTFTTSQNLITLDGLLYVKQSRYPLEARLTNIGINQPLILMVKLAQQELQLHYDQATHSETPLKLSMSLDQQIIPALKQLSNIKLPEIQMANGQLIVNATIGLPEQPREISNWLDALVSADASVKFSDIYLPENHITIKSNQLQLNWAEQLLTLNQQLPSEIKSTTNDIKWQATLNNNKPLTLNWQQPNITLVQSPNIELKGQGQHLNVQPTKMTINTLNDQVVTDAKITAKLAANQLVKTTLTTELGELLLSSQLNAILADQLITATFNDSLLESKNVIVPIQSFQEIQIKKLVIQPQNFIIKVDTNQPVNSKLLHSLQLKGALNFITDVAEKPLASHCDWQWQIPASAISCQTQPHNSPPENTVFTKLQSTNNQELRYQIQASGLELSKWPVSWFWATEQITAGKADINISGQTDLSLANDFSWQQWLKTLNPDSTLSIKQLDAISYQQKISQAEIDFLHLTNDRHKVNIKVKQVSNPSLPPIEDISANVSLNDDLASGNAKLSFALFGGEHLISIANLDLTQTKQQLAWQTKQLDLTKLITWLNIDGLQASGKLSGAIPFELSRDALTIQNANLTATKSGKIRYLQPGDNTPFTEKNIAFQALENFQYQELTLTNGEAHLPLNTEGAYRLPMRIVGHNPALYHGKSIAINPVISGTLPPKALYYLLNQKALTQGISTAKDD